MSNVTTFVLGGGRGTRLYPLTKYRSKPAMPLGGKYRLIDIPLSNCINSGLNKIYVLTQFLSVSLHRHIRQAYRFDSFNGGFVELLAAQQTMDSETDWYQGTADAVRKNLRYLEDPGIDYVLILSGDQLYRMDYRDMVATHKETGADVTIGGLPVSREEASALGIMRLDDSGRVLGFVEKPKTEEALKPVLMNQDWFQKRGITEGNRELLANMGIYLFNRDYLLELMRESDDEDFGKGVFPRAVKTHHVQMHTFDGYWEDIGTVRAFYEANIGLGAADPAFQLTSLTAPLYTQRRFLPPARIRSATISASLISDGCEICPGSVIEKSVIGLRCVIGKDVTIRNSVIFGNDVPVVDEKGRQGCDAHAVSIGEGSIIDGAIVDKNARIGQNVRIVNERGVQTTEEIDGCMIRDGIPVVLKDTVLPDDWDLTARMA